MKLRVILFMIIANFTTQPVHCVGTPELISGLQKFSTTLQKLALQLEQIKSEKTATKPTKPSTKAITGPPGSIRVSVYFLGFDTVKTKNFTLHMQPKSTIAQLKKEICDKTGIPITNQIIMAQERATETLEDTKILEECHKFREGPLKENETIMFTVFPND